MSLVDANLSMLFLVRVCFLLRMVSSFNYSARGNPAIAEEELLFEGDMILSKEQVNALYDDKNTRKAIGDVTYRWPDGFVPYEIHESSEDDRDHIEEALKHWMKKTCLLFEEVPRGSKGPHLIFKKNSGCRSKVGRVWKEHPNGQEVSIGEGCDRMGTIAHEIGHAIGFFHEHSRPDRDQFVKIFLDNVREEHVKNYIPHADTNTYGVHYDLGSIMHYKTLEFSKNGKNTLVPLDPMKHFEVGQREGLSFYDLKLAHIMYNCSSNCVSKESCDNGGFMDTKCNCQCPPNTIGTYCQTTIEPAKSTCGGIMTSTGTITSPNYPNNYPEKSKCVWWIKAPEDKTVVATFKKFDIYHRSGSHSFCRRDSVEVRIKSHLEGDLYCDKELKGKRLASHSNEMLILFGSTYNKNTGFKIHITFE